MAQLKDTVVQGSLRATDSLLSETGEFKIIRAPNGATSTTYTAGANEQYLKSSGSQSYWSSLAAGDIKSGILSVARGGTGAGTFTSGAALIGNGTNAIGTRAIVNSTSASAIGTSTSLTTEQDIYYGLPTINNAHNYTSSTNIYAPVTGGNAGEILTAVGATSAPGWKTPPVWHGTCSTAAATAIKDVVCENFPTGENLVAGLVIFVTFTITNSAAVADLKLRINSSADEDAKPIKYIYNGTSINNLPAVGYLRANQTYYFDYNGSQWVMRSQYNTDNLNALYSAEGNGRKAETSANGGIGLHRYSLQSITINNKWSSFSSDYPSAATTNGNDTAKTVATCQFLLNAPILYQDTNTNAAPDGTVNANGYTACAINFRQSGASKTGWANLTIQGPVYLIGQMQSDHKSYKLKSSAWWTQTLPTTNDGYIYIYLGLAYTATNVFLSPWHPIFWHDGTSLQTTTSSTDIAPRAPHQTFIGPSTGSNNGLPSWRTLVGADILDAVYPVGSIYMSTSNTSPATLFGGTWSQLKDRFLLGAGDTYTAGDTGGAATHTLITDEIPSHNHTFSGTSVDTGDNSAKHTHTYTDYYGSTTTGTGINESQTGSHTHGVNNGANYGFVTASSNSDIYSTHWRAYAGNSHWLSYSGTTNSKGSGSTHSHNVNNTSTTRTSNDNNAQHHHSVTAEGTIGNEGGGQAHNNMPPYLVVYMWKRTA